jgi:hypothetical protein
MNARRSGPNTYGHDRRNIKRELLPGYFVAWLPEQIHELVGAWDQVHSHPKRLPSLRLEKRARRSDFRERAALVGKAMAAVTDLATWQIALVDYADRSKRAGLTVKQIAARTGLSVRAVQRTIEEMNEKHFLWSLDDKAGRSCAAVHDARSRLRFGQQRIKDEDPDGTITYEALPAVREWTPKALLELGVFEAMKGARDAIKAKAKAARELAAANRAAAAAAEIAQELSNIRRLARLRGAPTPPPAEPPAPAEGWAARLLELTAKITAERSDLSAAEVRAEAIRQLEATGPPE